LIGGLPRASIANSGEKYAHETQDQTLSYLRASGEAIARRLARGEDRSDWKRVKAMSQAEVERLADEEEGPLPKG